MSSVYGSRDRILRAQNGRNLLYTRRIGCGLRMSTRWTCTYTRSTGNVIKRPGRRQQSPFLRGASTSGVIIVPVVTAGQGACCVGVSAAHDSGGGPSRSRMAKREACATITQRDRKPTYEMRIAGGSAKCSTPSALAITTTPPGLTVKPRARS